MGCWLRAVASLALAVVDGTDMVVVEAALALVTFPSAVAEVVCVVVEVHDPDGPCDLVDLVLVGRRLLAGGAAAGAGHVAWVLLASEHQHSYQDGLPSYPSD